MASSPGAPSWSWSFLSHLTKIKFSFAAGHINSISQRKSVKMHFPLTLPTVSSPRDNMLAWPQLLFLLQAKIRSASKSHWENIPDISLSVSKSLTHYSSLGSEKKNTQKFWLLQWYKAAVSNLLGIRDPFNKRQFSHRLGEGLVLGWLKFITFIVHFISIIITSAPPQIFRH